MLSLCAIVTLLASPAAATDSAEQPKVLQAGIEASGAAAPAAADTKLFNPGFTSRIGNKHKIDVYNLPWCKDEVAGFDSTTCDEYLKGTDKFKTCNTTAIDTAGAVCWQCEECVVNRVAMAYCLTLLFFFGLLAFTLWGVNQSAKQRAAAEGLPPSK